MKFKYLLLIGVSPPTNECEEIQSSETEQSKEGPLQAGRWFRNYCRLEGGMPYFLAGKEGAGSAMEYSGPELEKLLLESCYL